jgi:hypothetical protein
MPARELETIISADLSLAQASERRIFSSVVEKTQYEYPIDIAKTTNCVIGQILQAIIVVASVSSAISFPPINAAANRNSQQIIRHTILIGGLTLVRQRFS